MSDLAALTLGLAVGLAFGAPILWRYRSEIGRTWGEALGVVPPGSGAAVEHSDRSTPSSPLRRGLSTSVASAALLGSLVVAISTQDTVVRVVSIAACAVFALALGFSFVAARR